MGLLLPLQSELQHLHAQYNSDLHLMASFNLPKISIVQPCERAMQGGSLWAVASLISQPPSASIAYSVCTWSSSQLAKKLANRHTELNSQLASLGYPGGLGDRLRSKCTLRNIINL